VYNGEQFLRQALDTLVAQTYEHLEFIISDNASSDRTREICLEYAARDPRIKYYRNATNIGVVANFLRVVELSSGEYFMWAAVDDLKPLTAVERCVEALVNNPRAVLAHGTILVRIAGRDDLIEYPNDIGLADTSAAARVRAFHTGLQHHAMIFGLFRREVLQHGILGHCLGFDYLLCLQMCLLGPLEYVQTPIVIYQERKTVASSSTMYTEVPITFGTLLQVSKVVRRKCWTVLVMGCYYLATVGHVRWSERCGALAAHVTTFSRLYRSRLAKEVVFQLFEPVVWLGLIVWRLARRGSLTLRLARRVQARLTRSSSL
jgi:hypothetical protein